MAALPPGTEHSRELIPGQIVYRRFASETRTVEVTSTEPWPTKDPRTDSEKDAPTNTKEHTDKTLKWTQPCLREAIQNPEENQPTSQQAALDKNKSHPMPDRDKADTKFGEDGPHFGGRRLSLNARDKVVGGAAMMFTDPPYCSKTLDSGSGRRKSEYDVGRTSSVAFRPESRRLTEPTIVEHKIQSTLQVATNERVVETEAMRNSYPGSSNDENSGDATPKKNVLSTFKPNITLQGNNVISSGKIISDTQRENTHVQKKPEENTCINAKSSRPETVEETEIIEKNKLQTSSGASGYLATEKARKSDVKVKSEDSSLYSEKSNVIENPWNRKINSLDTNRPFSQNVGLSEPKTEDKEVSSSLPGLHPASDILNLKHQSGPTVQGDKLFLRTSNNAPRNEVKLEADKLRQPVDTNTDSLPRLSRTNSALSRSEKNDSSFPGSGNPSSSFPQSKNSKGAFPLSEHTRSELSRSENPNSSSPCSVNTTSAHSLSENTSNALLRCKETNSPSPHSEYTNSALSLSEKLNSSSPRFENTNSSLSHSENKGSSSLPIENTSNALSRSEKTKSSLERTSDTRARGPKMEGNKTQTASKSNTFIFHQPTDKITPRTPQTETVSHPTIQNSVDNHRKTTEEETISTLTTPQNHQQKDKNLREHPENGFQDLSTDKRKFKEDSKTKHNISATKTQKDKTICHVANVAMGNQARHVPYEGSRDAIDLNQSKLQNSLVTSTNSSTMSSSKETTKSPTIMKTPGHGKTEARDSNEKLITADLKLTTSKSPANSRGHATVSGTAHPTAVRSTVSSQSADQCLDRKLETGRSRSICCSSKQESRVSSQEPLASRSVTRSKSDVGVNNKGRTATPARKSCAGRRCCGAQPVLLQDAAALARGHSLSRGPRMGSTASLAPKNKSSWTTQRALESEVQQLKRELQMHKAEELRLHREIHKLRSVLQQATSFGEEATAAGAGAASGDPGDGALLTSLQDRHGMAGAAGAPLGASKKQGVSGESCEPESMEVPRHEKDIGSRQLIKTAILDNDFLKNLARSQIRELVDCMYPQKVQAGSYVIREGEAGSHLYVLDDGEMEVLKEGTVLGRMGPGKAFGELAILYNCTRTASIRAVSDLQVWVLDRRAFQQVMMRTGIQRLEDNIAFLRSVPLLHGIDDQTFARIADALEPEFYSTDEYIVRQGARGNTFFIISGGSVEVTQRGANGYEVVLRTLGRGEYFGEQALLHDDCRTASVRALPPGVDCLTLDRESFNALIGSLSELHHKDYAEDKRSLSSRTSFNNDYRKEDEAVSSLHLDDLRPLGTLGVGGFGCVRLVLAPNGRSYALKCLSKRHVAATGQQEHVAAERDVLLAARSPFIVRLFRTFRDEANVYLLLEACLGGEVWTLLREHERLPDKAARFVSACVVEALDYLHARDIIYRDLKPENLVMDVEGYVKLVDFGFCKRVPGGCKTWTFCGTPEYVAPEVLLNRGHDRAVDYWALGVLIYELLTGAPPFAAADPMGTYNLILLGMESAVMPKYMSRTANHLIRRLCGATPSERLGYQRGSFREVKSHRWFQDFDWDALRTQSMIPPIKPEVSGPADMSNFYPQTLDEELAPAELSHWDADF